MTRKKLSDLSRALLTFAVCLLPILPGLLLLPSLPEQVATHFDASGVPDGWMPKLSAVVMIPAFMALIKDSPALCARLFYGFVRCSASFCRRLRLSMLWVFRCRSPWSAA